MRAYSSPADGRRAMSDGSSRRRRISARRYREEQAASLPVPQSAREGHEIPGYTGYIPAVAPENVHGKTFREQNWHAAQGRGAKEKVLRKMKRTASAPAHVPPGYMGHMPGTAENVYMRGWKDTKVLQRSALQSGGHKHPPFGVSSKLVEPDWKLQRGRAGSEIPGYSGYIQGVRPEAGVMGGTTRNVNDKVHSARGLDPTHRPSHFVPLHGLKGPRRRAHKDPKHMIPGYMGHVAGAAENVHAKIQYEANHEKYDTLGINNRHGFSKDAPYDPRTPRNPPLPKEVDQHHTGVKQAISLPGYTGHVPGKIPNNVMGRTFRWANIRATQEKFHGRRDHDFFHPIHRSCGYGDGASVVSGATWTSGDSGVSCSSGKDWVSLADSGISLQKGRTAPGQIMRQPSLESLQSTSTSSSFSEAVSCSSGRGRRVRGPGARRRAFSAPPRRRSPSSDMGKTLAPASGTLNYPLSARGSSTTASHRSSSLSR